MSKRREKEIEMEVDDRSEEENEHMFSEDEGTRVEGIYIPAPLQSTANSNSGSRLIITQITNNFFKSYAENVVLGPFHKCFNAIVGPNGSGKSNVIDSLLFVFGYKASKIRCKRVSVLLHNSENFRNVQSCTVAVHFIEIIDKEGDDYEVVPGSELVISRTANKDNSSFYELNGRRVQFKEVALLLRKHGIDLDHNRFLILQGEVEQISMMKCKGEKDGESGMLEYLEDVIGTSRYKLPLEQLNERVEILTDRRTEKLNRLKMAETEMEELKQPMEEAVTYLKTENALIKNRNLLYQKSIKDLKVQKETQEASKDEVLQVQKYYNDKLRELSQRKEEHTNALHKEAKIYENLKSKSEGLKDAFNKANKKDLQLQENMININKTRKKTKEQIAQERKQLVKLEMVPEENEKDIKEIEKKLQETISTKDRFDAEKSVIMQNIEKETRGLRSQKEEVQKELTALLPTVEKAKDAFKVAETDLKLCIGDEDNVKIKLAELEKMRDTSKQTIEEYSTQIAELNQKIPSLTKTLNEANVDLLQVKQEQAPMMDLIRSKRDKLEDNRISMTSSRSRGRVLDFLMQAKKEGKCPGLLGRLGDLGAIDAKYDIAISTACGALDNVVVETVETAQLCIEFLKSHGVGRAMFIALDKQEYLRHQANSRIETPENAHRLYDLVKVQDERVKTAFYYALRDTLVANNLDQGSRIAYGERRYRVVTLQGDLIETTGTMSGGGKRVLRGRMGQSVAVSNVDPRALKVLEDEVQQMETVVAQLRQKQAVLEAQIGDLRPGLAQMQLNLEKYNNKLPNLRQQHANLVKQIQQQTAVSKSIKSDAERVKKLTALAEEKREAYEAVAKTAGELEEEINKLSKEIKDKGEGKKRTVEKHIRDCTKTIDLCKSEITKLKIAVKTAEKKYVASKQNIACMEKEVEDMENNLRAMKQQREEIEADAKKLLQCVEEITEQLEQRQNVVVETQKLVDEIVKKETKLKSEKVDVELKLKDQNKKLKEILNAIDVWRFKLSKLKLHDIPNEVVEQLKEFSDDELDPVDLKNVEKEIKAAERFLKAAQPNLGVIQEYRDKYSVYAERQKEVEEISNKRSEMRRIFDELRNRRRDEFTAGYNLIKLKLKELYQTITLNGDAALEMVDTYDPFTEGIQFNVRPPRKTWKKICNLSGGEKTLSSLALVFALHYYKPSPLYVMDEIDAALDFRNVSIVGNYIKERTTNAQFIIISLRSNMFELCDNLVGIYKTDNTTKSLTINPVFCIDSPAPQNHAANAPLEGAANGELEVNTGDLNNLEGITDPLLEESTNGEPEGQTGSQNDSGESGMVTTDSHMDDEEEIIASSDELSS